MTYIEDSICTADRLRLYTTRHEAANARADVVVVHGLGEHSGRYLPLINYLVQRNYSVTAYDHRGHGKSEGLRGHVERFTDYEDDLDRVLTSVQRHGSSRGTFIIGHSMGGLVTLRYAAKNGSRLAGAVVSAPAIKIATRVPSGKLMVARISAMIAPRSRVDNGIDPSILSKDPEVGKAYAADPLVNRLVSARWFAEITEAMREARGIGSSLTLPLLVLQGTGDRLISEEGTKRLFEAVESKDKELKLYAGYYHELFNEPEKWEIYELVADWLDARAEA
ncbi:MAG TPA: lysophospholipase [Blastocatellia bacterium]|jgi:lysophospholipase|nr:lysophospholipase [Blastocatellia bacterium]